jgi:beta-lactamase regulating signal transducer with metallopeptidase domain
VWLWWSARYLNPLATCQLPQVNETVSLREQLQNLTCNPDKTAETTSAVSETKIQAEKNCDVRTLAIGCLILLMNICAMIIGLFVYIKFNRTKRRFQDTLLPMESETI